MKRPTLARLRSMIGRDSSNYQPFRHSTGEDFRHHTVAVCIGIGAYADPAIDDLKNASIEAANVAAALKDPEGCAIPPDRVKLCPPSPTRKDLLDTIEQVVSLCDRKSVLIVYYSGHAVRKDGEFYICPASTRKDCPEETAVSAREVVDLLIRCPARGVLLILDCCASAEFAGNAPRFFHGLAGADFRIVVGTAREDERSYEFRRAGSLFSQQLIRVLRGETVAGRARPGEITFGDLYEAIHFGLRETYERMPPNSPQPVLVVSRTDVSDPLLFLHRRLALEKLTVDTDRVSRDAARRRTTTAILSLASSIVVAGLAWWLWVDQHEYVSVNQDRVVTYRGYPGWNLPGYPQLQWEQLFDPDDFRPTSPLMNGRPLVSEWGRPIAPRLEAERSDAYELLADDPKQANGTADNRFSGRVSGEQKRLLTAAMRLAIPGDEAWLGSFVRHPDDDIQLTAIAMLFHLNPKDADASIFRSSRFEFGGPPTMPPRTLRYLVPPCFPGMVEHLGRLLHPNWIPRLSPSDGSTSINAQLEQLVESQKKPNLPSGTLTVGPVRAILRTALRLGCPLEETELWAAATASSFSDQADMARFETLHRGPRFDQRRLDLVRDQTDLAKRVNDQRLHTLLTTSSSTDGASSFNPFGGPPPDANTLALNDASRALFAAWYDPPPPCSPENFKQLAKLVQTRDEGNADPPLPFFLAANPSCGVSSLRISPRAEEGQTVAVIEAHIPTIDTIFKTTNIDQEILELLVQRKPEGLNFLLTEAALGGDTLALREARILGIPANGDVVKILSEMTADVRREAYLWYGSQSPEQMSKELLRRIGDLSFKDWPNSMAALPLSDETTNDLQPLVDLHPPIGMRAAAVLAARGSLEVVLGLLRRPELSVREATIRYLGARPALVEEMEQLIHDFPNLVPELRLLRDRRTWLKALLDEIPAPLKDWWIGMLVDNLSGGTGDSDDFFDPGTNLWLEQQWLTHSGGDSGPRTPPSTQAYTNDTYNKPAFQQELDNAQKQADTQQLEIDKEAEADRLKQTRLEELRRASAKHRASRGGISPE